MSSTKTISRLQFLRGISVVAVVLFHLNSRVFPLGYLGVDIFFCISGYLLAPRISGFLPSKNFKYEFVLYLKKRVKRILPALTIMLIIFIPLTFLFGYPEQHSRIFNLSLTGLIGLANFGAYYFSGDYFDPALNPVLHIWSLSAEVQSYVLAPILFLFMFKSARSKLRIKEIPVVLALALIAIQGILDNFPQIYETFKVQNGDSFSYYSPIPRLAEFCIGAAAFSIGSKKREKSIVVLLGIAISTLVYLDKSPTNLGILISYSVSFLFLRNEKIQLKGIFVKFWIWLGDRSYSIYLYHLPVIYFSTIYFWNGLEEALSVILMIFFSQLSYHFIEKKKITRMRIEKIFSLKKLLPILCLMIVGMIFISQNHYLGLIRDKPYVSYDGSGSVRNDSFMDVSCDSNSPCNPSKDLAFANRLVLIGDSRAEMYSKALHSSAKAAGYKIEIWTTPGCRVTFNKSRVSASTTLGDCLERNQSMFDYLKNNPPKKLVISEAVYSDSDLDSMKDALSQIMKLKVETFFIKEIPLFPDKETYMVQKPLISFGSEYSKSYPMSKMNATNFAAQSELYLHAEKLKMRILDPTDAFCRDKNCFRYFNGEWLYSDAQHLSSAGALRVKPLFNEIVFKKT